MSTLAVLPGDPFKDHLLAVLSLHDAPCAAAAPVPRYSGPRDWQTDAILRKDKALLSGRRPMGTSPTSIFAYPNNTNNGRPGTPDSDTSYNTALDGDGGTRRVRFIRFGA
ncbi:hypothetical protein B0H13DRAFT_2390540 [Mycena leptocephala]|nr:hypothetical protein B0H13DRAFT_2390540 [Mycena leptocephala]